jgi:hypothetical protein
MGGIVPPLCNQRADTTIPPTMRPNAATWYNCGSSPRKAADSSAVNSGVRLMKNALIPGPARWTDRQVQQGAGEGPAPDDLGRAQRPLAAGQRGRPQHAICYLGQQEGGPVRTQRWHIMLLQQRPAVERPDDRRHDHDQVARHQAQRGQLGQTAPAHNDQHAGN